MSESSEIKAGFEAFYQHMRAATKLITYITETGEHIDDGKIVGKANPGLLPAPSSISINTDNNIRVETITYTSQSALTFKEYMKQCDKMKGRKW